MVRSRRREADTAAAAVPSGRLFSRIWRLTYSPSNRNSTIKVKLVSATPRNDRRCWAIPTWWRDPSRKASLIPVPPVEHLAVEQYDVLPLPVGLDVGHEVVKLRALDHREQARQRMRFEPGVRINLNRRSADRRSRLRQGGEADPVARLTERGGNLTLAPSGRLKATGFGHEGVVVVRRDGAGRDHGAPW
jgi:hypothetical protein